MLGEFLRKLAVALESTGTPYMLTGSLASSLYGVPRATNDIDFVVSPTRAQLESLLQFLKRLGLFVQEEQAFEALRNGSMFNVIDFRNSWKVDFIVRKNREFNIGEFERRTPYEVGGMRLTIASPEDVIISKLEWSRSSESDRQIEDAAGVLQYQRGKLKIEYIEKWVEILQLQEQWAAAKERAG